MKSLPIALVLLLLQSNLALQAQFCNSQVAVFDVKHYTFHLEISDTTDVINAKAILNIRVKKEADTLFLNLKNKNRGGKGMHIHTITNKEGNSFSYTHKADVITIIPKNSWKKNELIELEIWYSGIPEDGLYIKKSKYDKKTFFGDNWPNRAQYWLPVIDHPSDKAIVTFYITVPKHLEVVASGRLLSKKQLNKKQHLFHFKTEQELPTKVMVLGAADFKIKQLDTINKIPVSSWIYKESPDAGFYDYKPAVAALKYFDSIIAPYPYTKLANVQSKTRFGGMENAGNIFYFEASVNGKNQIEPLIAHEVAHQWFGNSVTEKNWRDIWLSEGFATYLTNLYLEHKYGKEKLIQRMGMERNKVIRYSLNPAIQPIVYDEKENLFKLLNRNSYEKGAWVLHMLRAKVGDDKFFKILRLFYETYKNSNASTEDFIGIVHAVSNQDFTGFFNQWLYRSDIPIVEIDWKIEGNKILIDVIQKNNKPFTLDLPIKIHEKDNSRMLTLVLDKTKQRFEFPIFDNSENIRVSLDPEVQVLFYE